MSSTVRPGDRFGTDVQIDVISVEDGEMTAAVVSVNEFWSHPKRSDTIFEVGQTLTLHRPAGYWVIKEPRGLPWFVLMNGSFEHYR
jgi:hypothetical protein